MIDNNKPNKGYDRLKIEDIRDSEFLPPELRLDQDIYDQLKFYSEGQNFR